MTRFAFTISGNNYRDGIPTQMPIMVKKFWQFQAGVLFSLLAVTPTTAQAQFKPAIVPDATLPVNSIVNTPDHSNFTIEGGTRAGNNLFHSFERFSVPTGGSAFFNNLPEIQNIFTRVTGSSASNIDGILQANGTANLFLLNPHGIILGQNAQLNIGGSFVATTANAIGFGNLGFFIASAPNNPSVLTVQPSALLFNQIAGQTSTEGAQKNPGEVDIFGTLQVPDGKSLLVVGGNIILNGGSLQAPGGVVNVGGLAAPGTVGLSIDVQNGNSIGLSFPLGVLRADVTLDNGSKIDVSAGGGGSIGINAKNFQVSGASSLNAGIGLFQGESGSQAGDITVDVTDTLTVDNSLIQNAVSSFGTGNAGNIKIDAPNINVTNNGFINNSTAGMGNAGNIEISTHNLSVTNAQILANTSGQGNTGKVNITATDNINFDGPGGVSSTIFAGAEGNGGGINIIARNLSITNGAEINTSTFGLGNAGNINLSATDTVLFDSKDRFSSAASKVNSGAVGNGGDISITARTLSLMNGSVIFNSTEGTGNAGNMNISASDTVSLLGFSSNGLSTGVYSRVLPGAIGNSKGGEIIINTSVFNLADGAVVTAQTLAAGKGGTIIINAKDLSLDRGGQILTTSSSSGNAGDININTTGSITLAGSDRTFSDRKEKIGDTFPNQGAASGLFANTDSKSTGLGGNLTISTGEFSIRDGAQVTASSQGTGNAGNIVNITARSLNLDNGSIITISPSGNGGNIQNIQVQDLRLSNQSYISTSAGINNSGSGNGGNITFNTGTPSLP